MTYLDGARYRLEVCSMADTSISAPEDRTGASSGEGAKIGPGHQDGGMRSLGRQ